MRQDLSERAAELRAGRVPFVHARVVLAEAPTSAKPGDEAIVTSDGAMLGFVGGTCAEATVRDQSLALLAGENAGPGPGSGPAVGGTLVLRITPVAEDPSGAPSGKRVVHNPCLSGGTLEVFLEAELPPLLVVVAGRAPIAAALDALGAHAGFEMQRYGGSDLGPIPSDTAAVVVASHGAGEEDLLTAALEAGVPYVGLVASRRRGGAVVASLPVSGELRARVHTPAGLDIGARTPEEVALSILAEIVSSRPRPRPRSTAAPAVGDSAPRFATDPVCGMSVRVGAEALSLPLSPDGSEVWFCGRGCRDAFAADPAAYASG